MEDLIIYMILAFIFLSMYLQGYVYNSRLNFLEQQYDEIVKRLK